MLENTVSDNSAPFPYIMGGVLAEVAPSPAWVLRSASPLLSSLSSQLNSSSSTLLLLTPVRLGHSIPPFVALYTSLTIITSECCLYFCGKIALMSLFHSVNHSTLQYHEGRDEKSVVR